MRRSESKSAPLCELGAVPVVAAALHPDQVADTAGRARPDLIVDELTAVGAIDPRRFDRDFVPTSRLRADEADCLLSARQVMGCAGLSRSAMARTHEPVML